MVKEMDNTLFIDHPRVFELSGVKALDPRLLMTTPETPKRSSLRSSSS